MGSRGLGVDRGRARLARHDLVTGWGGTGAVALAKYRYGDQATALDADALYVLWADGRRGGQSHAYFANAVAFT